MKQIVVRLTGTVPIERNLASMWKLRGLQLTVVAAELEYLKLQRGCTVSSHQPYLATFFLSIPSVLHPPCNILNPSSRWGRGEQARLESTFVVSDTQPPSLLPLPFPFFLKPPLTLLILQVLPLPRSIFQAAAGPAVPHLLGWMVCWW